MITNKDFLNRFSKLIGKNKDIDDEDGWGNKDAVIEFIHLAQEGYACDELFFEWTDDAIWHYAYGLLHGLSIGWKEEE